MNSFLNRLSTQDKIMFVKRLAILVKAGIPLLDSLQILKSQPGSRAAFKIFSQITADVERGQFLASSLGAFRNVFGDFAVNVVRVGEMSGTLEENLNYLAQELQKKQELKRKIIGAMVYPAIVVVATIALSALLTIFIFPKVLPIFATFKFQLPLTTRILIFMSNFLIDFGLYILLGFIVAAVIFVFFRRLPRFRILLDSLILKLPLFGRISQSYHIANFCRTLGLLLKSQFLVVEATRVAGSTMQNLVYRREIEIIAQNLLKGERMSTHLIKKSNIFPSTISQMVQVGESTGNLSDTLLFIADLYENELDMLTKNLSTTLEPVLMIIMGAMVGFIAVSIITPIYEITQYLRR